MKLKTINWMIITTASATLASGIILHFGYHAFRFNHSATTFWIVVHIVAAALLTLVAVAHVAKNRWWFATLRRKLLSARQWSQRVATSLCLLLFIAAFATGVSILFGWHPTHSHIWQWHYVIGLVWALFAIYHALAFRRKREK